MKLRSRRTLCAGTTMIAWTLGAAFLNGQAPSKQEPLTSEKAFKNVKVLTGIPVDQFMAVMGFFSASLGENCTFCHGEESSGSWEKYADDNAVKLTARRMIGMVSGINKSFFGGRRMVTCYSCHHAGDRPARTPSLIELYGPPLLREPDELVTGGPTAPSVDQILNRYIEALGGAQRLGQFKSFAAKGTAQAFAEIAKQPVDIFAKAPGLRTITTHALAGDTTVTYDGRVGWIAAPSTDRPMPIIDYTGNDLDGVKLDAALTFPGEIKQSLSQWRVGLATEIDDRAVQLLQGTFDGRNPVNLYFDSASGLLVRVVRYTESLIGLNPTQIDYADYRVVAGVKMPYRWTVSWLDGRSTIQLTDVQPNVAIPEAKFAKPTK